MAPAQEIRAVDAIIFDMDGTMIDSMPHHSSTWLDFARKHEVAMDIAELMRRTTGRTGLECVRLILDQPDMDEATAWALVHEKEQLYRDIFGPIFQEVAGFSAFYAATRARGLKVGVGTAGDIHNVEFAMGHLRMNPAPDAIARGDEGLSGKPTPAIFLAVAERMGVAPERCIVFEDAPFGIEAARRAGMRAVGICTTNTASALAGTHVITCVRDYNELIQTNFLEHLNDA
ncbi:haloacid dehalogenase [Rhodoferax koreense]|uniref:Haloacid dehalogenase n=1 Tax=Rhodoferax koreensis TaxID=1842727 RepID=A0A1P8JUC0_9BURK|nr:HAD family phosphatase [Rhodoferax koreense]APW37347.1 haloacid dehalogenase [Rhodoferax koreense]